MISYGPFEIASHQSEFLFKMSENSFHRRSSSEAMSHFFLFPFGGVFVCGLRCQYPRSIDFLIPFVSPICDGNIWAISHDSLGEAEIAEDLQHGLAFVEGVKVQSGRSAIEQFAALRRGVLDAVLANRLRVVAQFVQPRRECLGELGPAHGAEFFDLPGIGHRDDPGEERRGDALLFQVIGEPKVVGVVEKHLRDDEIGAAVDFANEMPPIDFEALGAIDVALRETGGTDTEATTLAEERNQLGGVLEAAFGLCPIFAGRRVTTQGEDVLDAAICRLVEDAADLCPRVFDAGEMRHRGEAKVVLDTLDDLECFLAGAAARAVSDGGVVRLGHHQRRESLAKKSRFALGSLERKKLERDRGLAGGLFVGVDVTDVPHARQPRENRRAVKDVTPVCGALGLHIAHFGGVPEGGGFVVPVGDELLRYEVVEACGENGAHYRGVVNFLRVVEFAAAGVAGGVVVADVFLVFADVADDVAVHDLHVINVEQQLEVRRANLLDGLDAKLDIVALIAGVTLHRVAVVHGVEVLEADRDAVFLGVTDDLFPRLDAVANSLLAIDAGSLHADKCDHALGSELLGDGDAINQFLDAHRVIGRVVRPLAKAVAADERDFQSGLAGGRIKLATDALDASQANINAGGDELVGRHRVEGPTHDRLADAFVFDFVIPGCRGAGQLCLRRNGGGREGRTGGGLDDASAGNVMGAHW